MNPSPVWFRFFTEIGYSSSDKETAMAKWTTIAGDNMWLRRDANDLKQMNAFWSFLKKCETRKVSLCFTDS
jgi:hypothetical protein